MPKPTSNPDTQVTPNPALEKRSRRTYTAEYKLSILAKADVCNRMRDAHFQRYLFAL